MSEEQPQRKSLLKEEPTNTGQPEQPADKPHGPLDAILRRYGDNPAQVAVILSEVLTPRRHRFRQNAQI
ncbi:MAG: hypothetical protein L6Q71_05985 [Planctomycetes bacterium]|nr:hypothetical protein [Planctomycetota bacterium]NUQ34217.1 hypothetical protein [Planctomycetaceae bacterium]